MEKIEITDAMVEAGAKAIAYLELERRGEYRPTQEQVDLLYKKAGSVYRTDARAVLRAVLAP